MTSPHLTGASRAAFGPVLRAACRPRFWTDYYFLTQPAEADYADLCSYEQEVPPHELYGTPGFVQKGCRLTFPLGACGLALDFNCSLDYFSLEILKADGTAVEIGWDDQAGWHPHVLRWEELDAIGESLARHDRDVPHPGLAVLLLARFAPITDADDAARMIPVVRQAWARVGAPPAAALDDLIARLDKRGAGFEWRRDAATGWTLHQDRPFDHRPHLYTLRSASNPEFPFAELEAAFQQVHAVHTPDTTPRRGGDSP